MKKSISKFSKFALSKEKMKGINGGWNYAWQCNCGTGYFGGGGDLNDFRASVKDAGCGSGMPVVCDFYES